MKNLSGLFFLLFLLLIACSLAWGAQWSATPEGVCGIDATASDKIDNDGNGIVDTDCSNASDAFSASGIGYLALARDFLVVPPATLVDDATVAGGKILVFGGDSPKRSGMAMACGAFAAGSTKLWVNLKVSEPTKNVLWPLVDTSAEPTWDNSFSHIPLGNQTSTVFTWDVVSHVGSNAAFATRRTATTPFLYTLTAGRHCFTLWGQSGTRVAALGTTTGVNYSDFLPATAPILSGFSGGTPTATGTTVTWNSNLSTDTQIEYGPTAAYGVSTTLDPTLLTEHAVTLTGLLPSSTYHWKAKGRSAAGVLSESADQTMSTVASATTGTIAVSTVGENGLTNTAASVDVRIDALTSAVKTTTTASLASGGHTVTMTDVPGLVSHYGTCTYSEGGAACPVSSFPLIPTCNGSICTLPVTVTAGIVTKVVGQTVAGPRTGYATAQVGGMTGSVITVNNVSDLLALETTYKTGNVYVTFGTGGIYELPRNLVLTGSGITLDCYTAPGRDVTFTHYGFDVRVADTGGGDHATSDVIIQGCHFDKGNYQFDPTDTDVNIIRVGQVAHGTTYAGSNVVNGLLLDHNSFLNCLSSCVSTEEKAKNISLNNNLFDTPSAPDPTTATVRLGDRTDRVSLHRNVILGPQGLAHSFADTTVGTPTGASHIASNLFGTSQSSTGLFNAVQLRQGVDVLFENNTLLPLANEDTLGTVNLAGNATVAAHPYKLNNNVIVCAPSANAVPNSAAEPVWCPSPTTANAAGDVLIRNNAYPFGACSTCVAAAAAPSLLSTVSIAPSVPAVTLENAPDSACHAFQRAGPFPRSAVETARLTQFVLSNCAGSSQPSFDFTIASNTNSLPVARGTTAQLTITLGLFSGSSAPVTLSTSGLPANVTASYSLATCSPACTSVLTITAGSSAAVASTPITVTGTASGVVHSVSVTVVVNTPGTTVPLGFWKMDEGTGTTLADTSGNNNSLTVYNGSSAAATWVTSPTAISFDGSNDIAYTSTLSSQVPRAKTMTAWVYWMGGGHAEGWVAGNPSEGSLIIQKATSKVCYQDNASVVVCSTATIPANAWTFIAAKSNGLIPQTVNVWVGQTVANLSLATGPPLAAGFQQFGIGGVALGPTARPINARIRYVRLYASALSDAELTTLSQELVNQVQQVATPTFSPGAGNYTPGSTQSVVISSTTPGAAMYYTSNGTTPTTASTLYTVPVPVSTTTTLKAIATKAAFQDSAMGSAGYTFTAVGGCDTAGLQVPCVVTALRTVIVDSAAANNPPSSYTSLQAALTAAQPGDWIKIKKNTGGYSTGGTSGSCSGGTDFCLSQNAGGGAVNGTQANPIRITSFDPNNKAVITDDLWLGAGAPVVGGQWVILEDLEFTNTESEGSGIRQFAQHVTLRRIYSHGNWFQGMWLDNSHLLLEDSRFTDNGSQGNGVGCMGDWDQIGSTPFEWNPAHCHGIYGGGPPLQVVNNFERPDLCEAPHHVTIRRNWFENNGGSGFQQFINTNNCKDPIWGRRAHNYLIENNVFRNNGQDFYTIGMDETTIRNNTIVKNVVVDQSKIPLEIIEMYDLGSNVRFMNNLIVSPFGATASPPSESFYVHTIDDQAAAQRVIMDYNGYFMQSDTPTRTKVTGTFLAYNLFTQWKSISGKDANSLFHDIDVTTPGLVDMAGGNFHLTAGAAARNKGLASQCPTTDYDGVARTSTTCDLGAFGFH